jgi:3-dehydroquinate synthetase
MQTLIIHSENKKIKVIKTILKALDVNFEIETEKNLSDIIEKAREDKKLGRLKTVNPQNIWESIP